MHRYEAIVEWSRGEALFSDNRYSRLHEWRFDGGIRVPASSSPQVVRVPMSEERAVDPEEALVAAASSCHLLSFLYVAAVRGFVVDRYADTAYGVLERIKRGKLAITRIVLRPQITFAGPTVPTETELGELHHAAHESCYIANSLKAEVVVETSGSQQSAGA